MDILFQLFLADDLEEFTYYIDNRYCTFNLLRFINFFLGFIDFQ